MIDGRSHINLIDPTKTIIISLINKYNNKKYTAQK